MALSRCPHCDFLLGPEEVHASACPDCGQALPGVPAPPNAAPFGALTQPRSPGADVPRPVQAPRLLWAAVLFLAVSNVATWVWLIGRGTTAPVAGAAPVALVEASRPPTPAATEPVPAAPLPDKAAPDQPKEAAPKPPAPPPPPPENEKPAPEKPKDEAPKPPAPPRPADLDKLPPLPMAPVPPPALPKPPAVAGRPMPPLQAPPFAVAPPGPMPPPAGVVVRPFPAPPGIHDFSDVEKIRDRIDRNAAGEIVRLRLGDVGVIDIDLQQLQKYASLRELDLENAPVAGTGLTFLKGLKELRTVSLRGSTFHGYGLSELPVLTNLDLGDTMIDDADMVNLRGLSELRTLDLSGTQITGAGLEELTGLNVLNLSRTLVGDGIVEHLKGLKELRELDLRRTNVTDAGVAALHKALPSVKIVR